VNEYTFLPVFVINVSVLCLALGISTKVVYCLTISTWVHPRFLVGFVLLDLLCVMFCRSLFVLLSFFFWPLYCLFFFDLLILITPLVSSNSSNMVIIHIDYLCFTKYVDWGIIYFYLNNFMKVKLKKILFVFQLRPYVWDPELLYLIISNRTTIPQVCHSYFLYIYR
jgi:hypothetical protein